MSVFGLSVIEWSVFGRIFPLRIFSIYCSAYGSSGPRWWSGVETFIPALDPRIEKVMIVV